MYAFSASSRNKPPTQRKTILAAVDSAASGHYLPADFDGGNHKTDTASSIVHTANGGTMKSVATDSFVLSGDVDGEKHECTKFIEVTLPLVSVGKLCVQGFTIIFDANFVRIFRNGSLVARGYRDTARNLYLITVTAQLARVLRKLPRVVASAAITSKPPSLGALPTAATRCAYNAYQLRVLPQLIQYLHGAAGFIPKATWIEAINAGFYATWPGLTAAHVRRFLPDKCEETSLGHLKLIRQGLRSTTKDKAPRNQKHRVDVDMIPFPTLTNTTSMDLPGRYPVTSAAGHKYIFIMYDLDSNYVKLVLIKSRTLRIRLV